MLKKQLRSLVDQQNLDQQSSFQIIHDAQAMKISGGSAFCDKLQECGTFTGACDNLTSCGTFQEKTAA